MFVEKTCENCKKSYKSKIGYNVNGRFCCAKCWYEWVKKNPKTHHQYSEEERLLIMKRKFEEKVIRKEGCWDWKGYCDPCGYPRFGIGRYEKIRGHRVSWILHKGPIENGKYICHHCDNPRCTNPDHLFMGTPKDNEQDMTDKGRRVTVLGRLGNRNKRPTTTGEKNPGAKLKEKSVIEIKKRLKMGVTKRRIARDFHVGITTIGRIERGETWKHIT
jgi:hypothetical protein